MPAWIESLESRRLLSASDAAWKLTWNDEFNGNHLDSTKWSIGLPWTGDDGTNRHFDNTFLSYITDDNVIVGNGELRLLTQRRDVTDPGGNVFHYTEGLISTAGHFSFQYGYVEIRAQIPAGAGRGLWPAFWMLGSNGWPPEDDVAEFFTSGNRFHQGLAYPSPSGASWDAIDTFTPLPAGFHTYGLEWGPGYQIFTVDGLITHTVRGSYVPSQPMYLLLNSGVAAAGPPTAATAFPNAFEVDYVRVYQRDRTPDISNAGFDGGALGLWGPIGNAVVVNFESHSGAYALRLHGTGSSAEQILTGLRPNTTYQVSAWAEVADPATQATLEVSGFGGADSTSSQSSTSYAPLSVTLTTGRKNRSAMIAALQTSGSGYAWFDDFAIRAVLPLRISKIPNIRLAAGRPRTIHFTLKGFDPADPPHVVASSSDPAVLPSSALIIADGDTRYTLTLIPPPDQFIVATVSLVAADDRGTEIETSFKVNLTLPRASKAKASRGGRAAVVSINRAEEAFHVTCKGNSMVSNGVASERRGRGGC